jgi:6-phosphogluconolactonase
MTPPRIEICIDADVLAARAAAMIMEAAREAIAHRGRFLFVLAGGSTPEKTYRLLAEPKRRASIEWK